MAIKLCVVGDEGGSSDWKNDYISSALSTGSGAAQAQASVATRALRTVRFFSLGKPSCEVSMGGDGGSGGPGGGGFWEMRRGRGWS